MPGNMEVAKCSLFISLPQALIISEFIVGRPHPEDPTVSCWLSEGLIHAGFPRLCSFKWKTLTQVTCLISWHACGPGLMPGWVLPQLASNSCLFLLFGSPACTQTTPPWFTCTFAVACGAGSGVGFLLNFVEVFPQWSRLQNW